MKKHNIKQRFVWHLPAALRKFCLLGLLLCLSACNQEPEFEEGEGTNNSNSGNGEGSTNIGGNGKESARLSWDIPSFRENGEDLTLSEIAGYEIVYRLLSEASYSVITIVDNNNSSHTIDNLHAGNYEFMIAVFDTEGLYSDYSDPVVATLGGN